MKTFAKIGTCAALVGTIALGGVLAGTSAANAHGYVGNHVSDVVTRAAMPANDNAHGDRGPIKWEPQSIEAPKGFTLNAATGGPADGKLASAGSSLARNLDVQSPERWVENNVSVGSTIKVGWKYTAPHKTSQWHYYITKNGWDQNKPLTRDELQPLATVTHDGSAAPQDTAHSITLPKDHTGDHIIYAVWDVADTANAFYNVIDVHIDGKPGNPGTPPTTPPVTPPTTPPVTPPVTPPAQPGPDTQAPSAPKHVHSMETTSNSVDLMWSASTDNVGVDHYEVQRMQGGKFVKIGTTTQTSYLDAGLRASTEYSYRVVAVDKAGNKSEASKAFNVTTKAPAPADPSVQAWHPAGSYKKGDVVSHNGKRYTAVQDHKGYGDMNWIDAPSLWKQL